MAKRITCNVLLSVGADPVDHVGRTETLGDQPVENGLAPLQRNGIPIDQAHVGVQHLEPFSVDGATKGTPQQLNRSRVGRQIFR